MCYRPQSRRGGGADQQDISAHHSINKSALGVFTMSWRISYHTKVTVHGKHNALGNTNKNNRLSCVYTGPGVQHTFVQSTTWKHMWFNSLSLY